MEYYAIYLPYKEPDDSIKSFYTDKEEALKMLKSHKEARLKAFRTSEEAVYFYLNGPTEPTTSATAMTTSSTVGSTTTTASEKASLTMGASNNGNSLLPGQVPKSPTTGQQPTPSSAKLKLEKTPFKAPKSQELVAFRKNIEKNELDLVRNIIELNPRYLVSSGDMPTILKEGPRYNALHVAAMGGNTDMCRLILATIENPAFIEFLHGQRNASTDEVSAILLDLYLNMPDKCRSETPLHFAAKFGSVGVIEVLISYPQCKLTKNSDGHLPKDIICARAKPCNDTPEIRRAIADLLRERFYVPVLRAVDRSTPPVVGEPFTLANPPNLEARDRFSPKLEIKAYAGPMDKEQAQMFCRRWKTPPRLIPSPRTFISPVKALSSSKIPVAAIGGGGGSPIASTPITKKGGRRTLFPNKSFELALDAEREKEEQRNNSINNNFEIDVVEEDAEEEALEEEALEEDVKNGNNVKPVKSSSPSVASSFLFRKYREPPLQNSFATIYDDDDEEEDEYRKELLLNREEEEEVDARPPAAPPTQIPVPVTPVKDSPQLNGSSFSYFCDGNNSFYEGNNITESPSFKERRLRLTDTEKGLEIIGRNLAEDHAVGWNEYWAFLGTFADLRNAEGLAKLEEYLRKRREKVELDEQEEALANVKKVQNPAKPSTPANDSLGSICDALDQMRLHTGATPQLPNFRKRAAASLPLANLPAVPLFSADPPEPPQIRSNITNPYLCLHNSLQVFAKRFVKNLDDACSSTMTVDFNAFFQQAVVDCVRKLNTLVGNYRRDAAFNAIDFSRVHSRYAQLIVINIESCPETSAGVIHRLKLLLDRSREVNSARKYPELHESLQCLQNLLDLYIFKKAELVAGGQNPNDADYAQPTEASCSRTWREDPLVRGCRCRIESAGGYAKKGSLERLVKRREQRRKLSGGGVMAAAAIPVSAMQASFASYRDPAMQAVRKVSTPVAVAKTVAGRAWSDEEDDDEDEEYFSCSDSELDTDSDVEDDDPNVSYVTPPSSPSSFLLQSSPGQTQQTSSSSSSGTSRVSTDDGVASGGGDDDEDQFLDTIGDDNEEDTGREPEFRNFIEGPVPTKQDVDVLNVVEKRPVDAAEFPHVHEWRQAMLRISPEQRERIATQKKPRDVTTRTNWRAAAAAGNDTSMNLADLSANQSASFLLDQPPKSSATTTPPSSPIRSVSAAGGLFRFGRARELASSGTANDSLGSLDGRLGLMNISDCGSGVEDTPKEGHRHRHQLIQQQHRIASAPSS
uniref:ANKLE2 third alpha/beta domain-containing protein n=1 Tax=Culex tarsalis TaxID=7177 RepID=A0A1Q3EZQ9_CULTA